MIERGEKSGGNATERLQITFTTLLGRCVRDPFGILTPRTSEIRKVSRSKKEASSKKH